ncbi:hypothetical protein [Burkholderia alba]|uniref:hypothetical protein n=1 Tax=Burkholderia alba TaxID=2683677 RepID=UPI002B05897A|nr:hypothetical protein [Burkholderia alba]
MPGSIFRNFIFAILTFLTPALGFASGAQSDIPFSLWGVLTLKFNASSITCDVVLLGRTNNLDQNATITKAYLYGDKLCALSASGGMNYPWTMKFVKGVENSNTPYDHVEISGIYLSTSVGDCVGEANDVRISGYNGGIQDELYFNGGNNATCKLFGTLRMVSKPLLSVSPEIANSRAAMTAKKARSVEVGRK